MTFTYTIGLYITQNNRQNISSLKDGIKSYGIWGVKIQQEIMSPESTSDKKYNACVGQVWKQTDPQNKQHLTDGISE